jgi:sulfur carrier protein ThiS
VTAIKVTVTLNGPLKKYLSKTITLELSPDSLLSDLLSSLALPKESVSLLVVNGKKATITQELNEGDHVKIYPPVCGG